MIKSVTFFVSDFQMKSSNPLAKIKPTFCCQFFAQCMRCLRKFLALLGLKCVYMTLTFRPQDWKIADGDDDGNEDGH